MADTLGGSLVALIDKNGNYITNANPTPVLDGPYLYKNITGQAGTPVKTGPGVLHSMTFNKPVATEVITIYDGLNTGGTLIGTITIPASPQPGSLFYDVAFTVGLFIQTATASSDITVSYL